MRNKQHATKYNKTKLRFIANNSIISFFIGLLIGIIITLLIILLFNNKGSPKLKLTNKPKILTTQKLNSITKNNSANTTNNYEFFNLLPKMTSSLTKKQYYIQTGTFHKLTEADELKAKLMLQNFESTIESSFINGINWYKVLLGPFPSEEVALTKKQQLISAGFKNVFIKINEN